MSDTPRKTLLVIQTPDSTGNSSGGSSLSVRKLADVLQDSVDIEIVAPENARAALQADAIAAVLAETGSFLPMAQDIANVQAS